MVYQITYKEGHGSHVSQYEEIGFAREGLNRIFTEATLWRVHEDGMRFKVGGVRRCEEHEKKRKNHKWFRWVDEASPIRSEIEEDFISLLEAL